MILFTSIKCSLHVGILGMSESDKGHPVASADTKVQGHEPVTKECLATGY